MKGKLGGNPVAKAADGVDDEMDGARWGRSRRQRGRHRRGQDSPLPTPAAQPRFLGSMLTKLQSRATHRESSLCPGWGTWGLWPLLQRVW